MSADPAVAFAEAEHFLHNGRPQDAEAILQRLAGEFPGRIEYEERLIEAVHRAGRPELALEKLAALLGSLKLTGDAAYDAMYFDALRKTRSVPVPLKRMLRFHELVKELKSVLALSGEVVECGCYKGMSSFLICSTLRRADPAFGGAGYRIFDSFEGLAEPTVEDEVPADLKGAAYLNVMSQRGAFAATLETVREGLADFPGIEYHPGWIPLSFKGQPKRGYRFVHVDVDHFDPTLDCLEYFYPQLVPGGVLVSDDFGWPGARKAIEEFCAERDIEYRVTQWQQAVIKK